MLRPMKMILASLASLALAAALTGALPQEAAARGFGRSFGLTRAHPQRIGASGGHHRFPGLHGRHAGGLHAHAHRIKPPAAFG